MSEKERMKKEIQKLLYGSLDQEDAADLMMRVAKADEWIYYLLEDMEELEWVYYK